MPNETTPPSTPPAPDASDVKIAALTRQLETAEAKISDLKEKLRAKAPAAPTNDHCVIAGKTYEIERTVTARFATDEARKGYIDLDSELIVLKRG